MNHYTDTFTASHTDKRFNDIFYRPQTLLS